VSAWPSAVWSTPLLRDLDLRARREIEAAGSLRHLDVGQRLFEAGSPADALFVVAEGSVSLRAPDDGAQILRSAHTGDALGEEALATHFGARSFRAACDEKALVASIPAAVLRRASVRDGRSVAAERRERSAKRVAALDALRVAAFFGELDDATRQAVADAVAPVELRRGATLFRKGEAATTVFVVASGMLQLEESQDGRTAVLGYAVAGQLLGDEALEDRPRGATAVVAADAWVLALDATFVKGLARRHKAVLDAVRKARTAALEQQKAQAARVFRPIVRELPRLQEGRSLALIDQSLCVRCGACASACATSHDDGVLRLLRRGPVYDVHLDGGVRPLLLPGSCHHCKNPECLASCPTGAIFRDTTGGVHIREELCTGCGACAKACPWDNVNMVARPEGGLVATKCDQCEQRAGGPACVAACPVDALIRIDGTDVSSGRAAARRPATLPALLAGVLAGSGTAFAVSQSASAHLSGAVTLTAMLLLTGHAVAKRVAPVVRPFVVLHVAVGTAAIALLAAHAGAHLGHGITGAAGATAWATLLTGMLVSTVYRWLPRRLAALERRGDLPEDLLGRDRALDDRIFRTLSGKSERLKTIYAHVLAPYMRSATHLLRLVAVAPSMVAEERRWHEHLLATLGDRARDLDGLDALVRLAVERRALRARAIVSGTLRLVPLVHGALTLLALGLAFAHAFVMLRYR
jgi:Fe-S-cluster-containing dehydrogenase component/CRP-like cAMP-binding protein